MNIHIIVAAILYVFVMFSVYFVLRVIDYDDAEDCFGFALCWPLVLGILLIFAPLWILEKSADAVKKAFRNLRGGDGDA